MAQSKLQLLISEATTQDLLLLVAQALKMAEVVAQEVDS